jgi:putative transposase
MPQRPRIHLAGVPLHIVQRGHNRDACFFGEDDYLAYRHWLSKALKESGCTLHAYVLMTNYVHLLLTPPQPQDTPRFIISLGRRYVRTSTKPY